jgi:hypothetical protein
MKYLRTLPLLLILGASLVSLNLACGDDHHDHYRGPEREVIIEPRR